MAFTIKQNDTLPNLVFQLFQPDKITPLDLTPATAVSMVVRSTTSVATWKKPCTITSAVNGQGLYDWDPADTATAGSFQYEFEIAWASGDIQTIPVDGYFDLLVIDDIG